MKQIKKIKNFDIFGQPIAIQFQGSTNHTTICGGLISAILLLTLFIYTCWRFQLFGNRSRDEYYLGSNYRTFESIGAFDLSSKGGISFEAYINNSEFDNDNNEYGQIKLHRYTNMDHSDDHHQGEQPAKVRDEIIPLKDCMEGQDKVVTSIWHTNKINKYCPDFKEGDYLYGDYYSEKFSWYRLIIHKCDTKLRESQGKTCKNQEEIDEYFRLNIVGIDLISLKPGLTDIEKEIPLFNNTMSLGFSVQPQNGLTMAQNVYLQKNMIELDDDAVGFYDETQEYEYLSPLYSTQVFYKPYGNDSYNFKHPDMIFFWNFILIHEGTISQRVRYQLLDILGEVGGIYSAVSSFFLILLSIYNYKLHESIVYQEFLKIKGVQLESNKFKQISEGNSRCLSLQLFFIDHFKLLRKTLCASANSEKNSDQHSQCKNISKESSEETVDTLLDQIDDCQAHFNLESILKISENELKIQEQGKLLHKIQSQISRMSQASINQEDIRVRLFDDYDTQAVNGGDTKKICSVDNESLKCIIDMLWETYDADGSGELDKQETKLFLKEALGNFGSQNQLSEANFELVFAQFDQDGSGTIEKDEMSEVIKQLLNRNQGVVDERWQVLKQAAQNQVENKNNNNDIEAYGSGQKILKSQRSNRK